MLKLPQPGHWFQMPSCHVLHCYNFTNLKLKRAPCWKKVVFDQCTCVTCIFVNNAHSYCEAIQRTRDKQVAFVAEKSLENIKKCLVTKCSESSPSSVYEIGEPSSQIDFFSLLFLSFFYGAVFYFENIYPNIIQIFSTITSFNAGLTRGRRKVPMYQSEACPLNLLRSDIRIIIMCT